MDLDEIIKKQKHERKKFTDAILTSKSPKKIIVAGPGTGKTYTFSQILKQNPSGKNLVLSFIVKLVSDMEKELGTYAEVKTFHAFCKKILHKQIGRLELIAYLPKIITEDAEIFEYFYKDFNKKFQNLVDDSPELKFYVKRAEYYNSVSFDDSVYKVYRMALENPEIITDYDQILIDEYQDFNPLEVAFISILENKGNILVVGDDDQAVNDLRSASPIYLREKYADTEFEKFELPFCNRSPLPIVKATRSIIENAIKSGNLENRIQKKFWCFLESKIYENKKYPKITVANCTTLPTVVKYIKSEIAKIPSKDIEESNNEYNSYPTVLIIGPNFYLEQINSRLLKSDLHVSYVPSKTLEYNILDGYNLLINNSNSNLGWRIIVNEYYTSEDFNAILRRTENGTSFKDLLDLKFINNHEAISSNIAKLYNNPNEIDDIVLRCKKIIGNKINEIINLIPKQNEDRQEIDISVPSILLTTFIGCKGLSAGHVFIVGVNNGEIPKKSSKIEDIEISRFIVALTRTRKACHIISNEWFISPLNKKGEYIQKSTQSKFVSWLPQNIVYKRGDLNSEDFKK